MATCVIGHRGASHDHPENTIEAFEGARRLGADWVELDVRRSVDGSLVVHHDPALADGRVVAEVTRAELPPSVCLLADALAASAPMGVNVEIKNDPSEPGFDESRAVVTAVLDVVASSAVEVLISSFDFGTIEAVKRQAPVPTGSLVYLVDEPVDAIARAVAGGHDAIHPWYGSVDEALVTRCHDAGLAINVWTVDDEEWIERLGGWGVDGIVTNRPDVALRALGR
jgi:glycerophosphoryl diester phosphodiesterase